MNVAPIDASLVPDLSPAVEGKAISGNFATWLDEQVRTTNAELVSADDAVRRLAVGEPVNLHQVMVQLERARLQLEMVVQVRNKLVDAYQDLLRMQL